MRSGPLTSQPGTTRQRTYQGKEKGRRNNPLQGVPGGKNPEGTATVVTRARLTVARRPPPAPDHPQALVEHHRLVAVDHNPVAQVEVYRPR